MHVVVVGCGRVGTELAFTLEQQGHSVAVVDRKETAFRRLHDGFSGTLVTGIGFDRDTLIDAGIETAGAVAAVTYGDNSNILVARIAHETYNVPNVVARIKDPRRALIFQRLGISTVATVSWTTDQMMRRLLPSATPHEWIDPSGSVCLLERKIPDAFVGKKLVDLNLAGQYVLTSVSRFGSAVVATKEVVGQDNDVLYFVVASSAVEALDAQLNHNAGGHH